MKTLTNAKLTTIEIAICTQAIVMLSDWDFTKGEPLAALTIAAIELFGVEDHDAIARINKAERMYAPVGAAWNNVEVRLAALRAVIKFWR